MATRYWLGGRRGKRAQVSAVVVTAYDAATTYSIIIGGNTVSVLGSGGTTATVATALQTALAASEFEEFREITWTVSNSTITGTANEAGKPFTATTSESGGAGTIGNFSDTTTNQSPNDLSDAANWSAATLPISGDSIVFERSEVDALWGLTAFAAVDIVSFTVRNTYTGRIGLNPFDDNGYYQYRQQSLQMQTCTTLYEEQASNLGTGERRYSVGANACTGTIVGDGAGTLGEEITWIDGTSTSNAFEVQGGSLALASLASESTSLTSLKATKGSVIRAGSATTFSSATVTLTDSTLEARSNIATLTAEGSSNLTLWNAMTVTTLTVRAGSSCVYNSSGTITTLNLVGSIDFSQDSTAVTITNVVQAYAGATFNDPDARVTLSAGLKLNQCRDADVVKDFGTNRTLTPS